MTHDELAIDVVGVPAPQGSKKGFVNPRTQRVVVVDDNKAPLKSWRQDVRAAAVDAIAAAGWEQLDEPVWMQVTFYVKRPQGHYGSGRNAGHLRESAPAFPGTKPDLDKLLRSTLDALGEAGCWRDDARVASLTAEKRYADQRQPGALIVLAALNVASAGTPRSVDATSVQEALL